MKKGKGKYQMLDNLNSKFESSRVQALDVNDDEVEIDLLEIFHALRKKILLVLMVALIGGCIGLFGCRCKSLCGWQQSENKGYYI
mgnify:CR=1 FL=1